MTMLKHLLYDVLTARTQIVDEDGHQRRLYLREIDKLDALMLLVIVLSSNAHTGALPFSTAHELCQRITDTTVTVAQKFGSASLQSLLNSLKFGEALERWVTLHVKERDNKAERQSYVEVDLHLCMSSSLKKHLQYYTSECRNLVKASHEIGRRQAGKGTRASRARARTCAAWWTASCVWHDSRTPTATCLSQPRWQGARC